ncbi:hypothetical protein DID78_03500 [Candidatus Marinamargulisbacteria bacterium SCGC AG-343-D04]|nr:hypothetical protein DID78_03500 [Candidatus Marinamargulisbacteria bacterium SCGC AG-343-D04]
MMNFQYDSTYLNSLKNIAIFGGSGSIGSAFINKFLSSTKLETLFTFSRKEQKYSDDRVISSTFDLTSEDSILTAKDLIPKHISLDLVMCCTGSLHSNELMPEKSLSEFSAEKAQFFYLTNTIGPSLIIKHFWPLLNKENQSIIASLCARIGSISDNKLGGWYSYRASKAALCMMIKSASIEIKRQNKKAICIALHPGTVDSKLSAPFQKHIDSKKLFTPEHAVSQLINTLSNLSANDSGYQFAYDGSRIPF